MSFTFHLHSLQIPIALSLLLLVFHGLFVKTDVQIKGSNGELMKGAILTIAGRFIAATLFCISLAVLWIGYFVINYLFS